MIPATSILVILLTGSNPLSPHLQESPDPSSGVASAKPEGIGSGDIPAKTGEESTDRMVEITPDLLQSCQKGMDYLLSEQNNDGSFGRGRYGRNVGIASLCALAFMADGRMPGQDKYGQAVQKTLDFILSCSTETGLIASDNTSHGPMYGHGFATLFLGEIYGMNPQDTRVRDALVRAVQLIINSQNDEGGWRYNPVPYDADVSVTICQVMGLRAARNAGIKVPRSTIDRAVSYVQRCQNPDGGFRYMIQSGTSAWPRTAAGVATLFYAGIYQDNSIDRGIDYLLRTVGPETSNMGSIRSHFYYGHYYATQAMFIAGGERWRLWWPAIKEILLDYQSDDGGWRDNQTGRAYATAMSLIILQMPKRYLPIFQK